MPVRKFLLPIVFSTVAAAAIVWIVAERSARRPLAKLEAPGGSVLLVEVASTPAARAMGLSNRSSLDVDGLLLQWPARGRHPIWMSEMLFALDIAWLGEDGRVLAVATAAPPCPQKPCPRYEPPHTAQSVAVLELPAGGAARHQIRIGAILRRLDGST